MIKIDNLMDRIQAVVPNARCATFDDDYDRIEWLDKRPKPKVEELLAAEVIDKAYILKRARALPSIQDQLDLIYWDKINGTTNWEDTITAVKRKFPKVKAKPIDNAP